MEKDLGICLSKAMKNLFAIGVECCLDVIANPILKLNLRIMIALFVANGCCFQTSRNGLTNNYIYLKRIWFWIKT